MVERILLQLIKTTPNVVYACDLQTYELHFLNDSGKKLFNVANDADYEGKKCYEVIQNRTSPCEYCTQQNLQLDDQNKYSAHNTYANKYFLYTEKIIFIEKELRLAILVDITETHAERTVKEALLNCVETLYTNKTPEESITELLHILATSYYAPHACIFEISSCREFFNCTHQWCADGVQPIPQNTDTFPINSLSYFVESLQKQGELSVNSDDESYFDATTRAKLKGIDAERFIVAPLYDKNNQFLGLVGVKNPGDNSNCTRLITSICRFVADFIEKNALIDSLNVLSYTDDLTKLKNRHSYSLRIAEFESNPPKTSGVIFFDVNGLKEINDKYGHAKGDEVLTILGNLLKDLFFDDAYRIAGDEFVVLQSNISQQTFESSVRLLRKHLRAIHELSVSFGHIWSENVSNLPKQIEQADSLMYTQKLLYYQSSQENIKYKTVLSNSLSSEIEAGKFAVFLQPQFTLKNRELSGAEALLRKVNSSKDVDSPAYFIPLYEKLEIVHLLDFYVFETICKVLREWREVCYDDLSISVNISRVTLKQPNIAQRLAAICAKYAIPPRKVIVEITETMQAPSSIFLSEILYEITQQGFLLSLDDFGSGYSSLLTLADSHFSEIKIDQGLIRNLSDSQRSLSMVQYTINMCNDLSIFDTVAEGIETEEVCELLNTIQCTKGQGYLFDKALPIDVFCNKYIFPKNEILPK